MKRCSRCLQEKELSNFSRDNSGRGCGYQSWCKVCKRLSVKMAPSYGKNRRSKEDARRRYYKNKVSFNFSRRMRAALGGKKSLGWEKLVGYRLGDLKQHLEKLFVDGMTWENYGSVWHIDHKRPVSSFKITSDQCESFKECWSLNNLQPLFAGENIRKGNKYSGLV